MKFSEIAVSCVFSLCMALSGELFAQQVWKADTHLGMAGEDEAGDEKFESNPRQRMEELRGWLDKRHQERGEDSPAPTAIPDWTYSPEQTERSISRHGKRHHAGHRHKHNSYGYRHGRSHSSRHTAHKQHFRHFKTAHRSHGAKSHRYPVHRQARSIKLKPTSAHSAAKRSGKTKAHVKSARR